MDVQERFKPLFMPALATLTLGLAPFVPQPHIWEKLTWIATGRTLAPIDVFDVIMHGAPWLWLAWTIASIVRGSRGRAPDPAR